MLIERLLRRAVPWVLCILLLSTWVPAAVAGPWQWKINLQGQTPPDAMIMPSALEFDTAKDRYYVVDSGNNRLMSFDREGKLLSAFNAGDSLQAPYDMVRDEKGVLWVVEKGRNSLTSIDLSGKTTVPHTLSYQGRTVYADRLAYAAGQFYVLDRASGGILVFDQDLQGKQSFDCPDCGDGGFVDFKLQGGELWALSMLNRSIYRFGADGRLAAKISLGDAARFPVSLAVDPAGPIYVLERHQGGIAAFDATGELKYRFLEPGQTRGQLYFPVELQIDPWGQLCVVDEGNGRVQIFGRY